MSDSVQNLIAEPEDKGTRIDKYLSQELEDVSRSRIQKLLDDGDITVDDKCVKSNYKLNGTEHITITIPELIVPQILPENIPLNIIYEDNHIIVVVKPVGIPVQQDKSGDIDMLTNKKKYIKIVVITMDQEKSKLNKRKKVL